MQEAARELTVFLLQVPTTLLHLKQAALVLIFPTVRAANKFEAFLRTLLWTHHSPEQVGTAGPGQHTTLGQRKLPSKNPHTSGKWFSKQLFHKALWKTLFQSHYSALEGVSSGRRNSSWSPGHSWLPIQETQMSCGNPWPWAPHLCHPPANRWVQLICLLTPQSLNSNN